MSSDVFIISSVRDDGAPGAIRQALELAGVGPARIQDVLFGLDGSASLPDLAAVIRAAGLECPFASVMSSLRSIGFAAASILGDDAELLVVAGLQPDACTALVLASPEAVGRLNLMPRARLAARSLAGSEPALRAVELTAVDIEICMEGEHAAALLHELLDELDARPARWGMVKVGPATIIVERI